MNKDIHQVKRTHSERGSSSHHADYIEDIHEDNLEDNQKNIHEENPKFNVEDEYEKYVQECEKTIDLGLYQRYSFSTKR